jgi:cytochrome b subunit of formate dehydrogenase
MKTIKNINSLEIVRVSDDKAVKMVEGYNPRQWMYVGKQEWKNKVRDVEKIGRVNE